MTSATTVMFLPGIERDHRLRELDVEDVGGRAVEPGAVDPLRLVPLLELDDDLDALLLAHGAHAEDRRDVDDADAADLHVVALQLVAAADEDVAAAARGDDEIVGDEPVPALDEIEHALRLADAALPDEEQPDAEHVGERAVQGGRRRELVLERRLDLLVELGRRERGAEDRRRRAPAPGRASPAGSSAPW